MSDRNEVAQNLTLAAVAGLVALVIAAVLGVAIRSHGHKPADARPAVTAAAAPASATEAAADQPAAVETLVFDADSAALPADSGALLARVADAARARSGATVLIAAFDDTTGGPARRAGLAQKRALAVRHALEANGVAPAQLELARPVPAVAGDTGRAQRVELTLR